MCCAGMVHRRPRPRRCLAGQRPRDARTAGHSSSQGAVGVAASPAQESWASRQQGVVVAKVLEHVPPSTTKQRLRLLWRRQGCIEFARIKPDSPVYPHLLHELSLRKGRGHCTTTGRFVVLRQPVLHNDMLLADARAIVEPAALVNERRRYALARCNVALLTSLQQASLDLLPPTKRATWWALANCAAPMVRQH